MRKGSIAICYGDFDSIDTSNYPRAEARQGETLRRSLRAGETITDLNGNEILKGRGARQDLEKQKTYDINSSGNITVGDDRFVKVTEISEFLCSTGEFVLTESTKTEFVFNLIADATGTTISSAEIDIEGLIDDNPDARYWMGGYYNHLGDVTSGDGYAEGDIFEDDDFGDVFEESDKNRIGMEFEFESDTVKMLVTEGGYIEVYQPSNYDSMQFKRLIDDVLLPHTFV